MIVNINVGGEWMSAHSGVCKWMMWVHESVANSPDKGIECCISPILLRSSLACVTNMLLCVGLFLFLYVWVASLCSVVAVRRGRRDEGERRSVDEEVINSMLILNRY